MIRRQPVVAALFGALLTLMATTVAAGPPIEWNNGIAWTPFEQALTRAKAENKAICVVVYADWCPKCRGLAPAFEGPPLTDATKDVIMVLQDSEQQSGWLKERFGDLGTYVPRIFFLRPDGSVNRDLASGHPRYPFFYTPGKAELLAANIHTAAQAAGGPAATAPPQPAAPPPLPTPPPAVVSDSGFDEDYGLFVLFGLLIVTGLVVTRLGRKDPES